jgi:hypothetical protein
MPPEIITYQHWWFTKTKHISAICNDQHLPATVQACLFAQIGRVMYPLNLLDHWEAILFLKGVARCGKSTLGRGVKALYEGWDVGVIANNMEAQFGLMSLCDTFINICFEVKSTFKMDESTMQCIASGEGISVAVKNEAAKMIEWNVPMMLIGNELPGWVDVSGSISRRLFLIEFRYKINAVDTNLVAKIEKNMCSTIWKFHGAYQSLRAFASGANLLDCTPKYFTDQQKSAALDTNPLLLFLDQCTTVTCPSPMDPDLRMPLTLLIKMFRDHLEETGKKVDPATTSPNAILTNMRQAGCETVRLDHEVEYFMGGGDPVIISPGSEWVIGVSATSHVRRTEESKLAPEELPNPAADPAAPAAADAADVERRRVCRRRWAEYQKCKRVAEKGAKDREYSTRKHQDFAGESDPRDDSRRVWEHNRLPRVSVDVNFMPGAKGTCRFNSCNAFMNSLPAVTHNVALQELVEMGTPMPKDYERMLTNATDAVLRQAVY